MADKKKPFLIVGIALGAVLLIAASVGATLMLRPAEQADASAGAEEAGESSDQSSGEAHYLAVEIPPVNLGPQDSKRFLQLEFQVMARSSAVTKAVEENMPAVRNDLILLLSDQSSDELATREGKEALREALKRQIERIIAKNGVDEPIKQVYLTRVVMQ